MYPSSPGETGLIISSRTKTELLGVGVPIDTGLPGVCLDMVLTIVASVGPQQFQYTARAAQESARCCVVGSPAVATVRMFGNRVGQYLDSIVGVQIRTCSFGADVNALD